MRRNRVFDGLMKMSRYFFDENLLIHGQFDEVRNLTEY